MPYFDQIYFAALHYDVKTLHTLCQQGTKMDEYRQEMTPASLLVSKGFLKAVELLIWFGADVEVIAIHAAWNGHLPFCDYLSREYHCSDSSIIIGATAGGHYDYVEARYKRSKQPILENLYCGAAMGGDRAYMQTLFNKYGNPFEKPLDNYGLILNIIQGTIIGKNLGVRDELMALLQNNQEVTTRINNDCLSLEAQMFPKDFQKAFASEKDTDKKTLIACGALSSGVYDYADSLLENGPGEQRTLAEQIIHFAVKHGHFSYAKKISNTFALDDILTDLLIGYASFNLLESHTNANDIQITTEALSRLKNSFTDGKACTYTLALVQNAALRQSLIDQMNAAKIFPTPIYDSSVLIAFQKAYLLNESEVRLLGDKGIYTFLLYYQFSNAKNLPLTLIVSILNYLHHCPYNIRTTLLHFQLGTNRQAFFHELNSLDLSHGMVKENIDSEEELGLYDIP